MTFYIGKPKRRLHDRKIEHFKALTKSCQASAIADHITSTGHNIKLDHFKILATGRWNIQCGIKESLLIKERETFPLLAFYIFFQQTLTLFIINFLFSPLSSVGFQSFSLAFNFLLYYIQPSLLRVYFEAYETLSY